MTDSEFCRLAAQSVVADLIDAGVISEDRSFDAGCTISGAIQAAVQHALLGVRDRLQALHSAALGLEMMPDSLTSADLVQFVTKENHPDR